MTTSANYVKAIVDLFYKKDSEDHTLKKSNSSKKIEISILIAAFLLLGFGILMIYSTTDVVARAKLGDPYYYVKRQILSCLMGVVMLIVCFKIPTESLKKYSVLCLPISMILLLLPLLPVIGDSAGGARRWIHLGVRFQPGELVKLLFIIYFSGYLSRHADKLSTFNFGVLRPGLLILGVAGIFLLHPDFGSFAVVSLVAFCMLAVNGVRVSHLLYSFAAGISLVVPLILFSPYRMKRIVNFLYPFSDPSGKGYQLIQSLIAVASGGISGVGLGDSQQKLFFLPAAHTDFIFAVISEELGFIGSCLVLVPFLIILWKGLSLAKKLASDSFSYSLVIGLTLLITLPAFLNVGVVTGILPTKGMVLPLISYGGTNLVMCLAGVGLLLGVTKTN